jgi:enoyl-CoA hydratase/carnithine racemase
MPAYRRLTIRNERGCPRLTPALVARLMAELEADDDAPFVALDGDADAFCEGMDLGVLADGGTDVICALDRFSKLLGAIGTAPKPVIALVGGAAMGGGVGLAAAADVVLATPNATFGLPEPLLGLVPATVYPVLARRIGGARARAFALRAATVSAAEAWHLGLVDELVDDLDAAAARYADRISRLSSAALAELKTLAVLHEAAPAEYHARAMTSFARLLASTDTRERIGRFLEGATPWMEREAT